MERFPVVGFIHTPEGVGFRLATAVIAAVAAGATGAFDTPLITETIPAFAVAYVLVMSVLGTSLMRYSNFFEKFAVSRSG